MKISKNDLSQIIKEEAERFVKIKSLEAQKAEITKQLNENFEMYETETVSEMDSDLEEGFFNAFKGDKNINDATEDFRLSNKAAIGDLKAAYDAGSPEYVQISKALVDKFVNGENRMLAKKHGITDKSDFTAFRDAVMAILQPMDYETFSRQSKEGSASLGDFVGGASAGRKGWTTNESEDKLTADDVRNIMKEEAEKAEKAEKVKNLFEQLEKVVGKLETL